MDGRGEGVEGEAMARRCRSGLPILLLAAAFVAVVGILAWYPRAASGQTATVRVVAPASVSASAASFQIQVRVDGVPAPAPGCDASDDVGLCGLASYEWQLVYNPAVIELTEPLSSAMANSDFLGSTGRSVVCPPPFLPPALGLQPGNVRYGCNSTGQNPSPPSGSGLLSTITFRPVGRGSATIGLAPVTGLSDTWGHPIPASLQGACIVIGSGSCGAPTPLPTSTAVIATDTPVPGQPTATPTTPPPTTVPPGPTTTPVPLPTPIPGEREQIQLVAGCNLRAFQPSYDPGTDLIAVVVDMSNGAGNPRLWFQVTGTTFFDLYDFRSTERSTKTVLGAADEAGFICLDSDAVWNRPVIG